MYVCMYVRMVYVCMYLWMYVFMYVCMYVCSMHDKGAEVHKIDIYQLDADQTSDIL